MSVESEKAGRPGDGYAPDHVRRGITGGARPGLTRVTLSELACHAAGIHSNLTIALPQHGQFTTWGVLVPGGGLDGGQGVFLAQFGKPVARELQRPPPPMPG